MSNYPLCPHPGHEWVGDASLEELHAGSPKATDPDTGGLDSATHRIRIVGPPEAVKVNAPEFCCGGCAAKLAEAWVGMDYDVEVAHRDRLDNPFSPDELALIAEALDSHAYWQLAPAERRSSGYVLEPHTEEEKRCMALEERVDKLIPTPEQT